MIFDSPKCTYDIIYFLQAIDLKMDFANDYIQWLDTIVDMRNIKCFENI